MTENNIYFDPFSHRTCSRTTSKLEKKTNPLQLDTKAFTFYVAQQIKIKSKYFVRSTWSAQSSNSKMRYTRDSIRNESVGPMITQIDYLASLAI